MQHVNDRIGREERVKAENRLKAVMTALRMMNRKLAVKPPALPMMIGQKIYKKGRKIHSATSLLILRLNKKGKERREE